MRKPALAIGGVAMIVAGVAIAFGWGWWPTPAHAEATADVRQPISSVRIDNDSGDVRIRIEDTTTTSVHQTFSYRGNQPGQAFTVTGGQLVLAGCGNRCSVDYEVVVPRGTAVTGGVRSGDVTVEGAASADLSADSGDVRVFDCAGPVTASAKSGDVEVRLTSPQDVRAQASSGDVMVVAPRDHYRVQGDTDSGERKIDVVQDPAAPHVLDLSTNSGDVTVTTG